MIFRELELPGAYLIELEPIHDERGFFARSYCEREFGEHCLNTRWVQCNISFNRRKGTLRGLHYQAPPHEEIKLIRVTRGALYDVLVDIRPESPAYRKWVGVELTADNARMLYVPEGLAHGFQTLADDTEVFYQMSEFYNPQAARGLRWDDPELDIEWPGQVSVISEGDRGLPFMTTLHATESDQVMQS